MAQPTDPVFKTICRLIHAPSVVPNVAGISSVALLLWRRPFKVPEAVPIDALVGVS
jgi:hypothetical protein